MSITNSDLTQHPPRSPRVRLGGYVLLPRILKAARRSPANWANIITAAKAWTGISSTSPVSTTRR